MRPDSFSRRTIITGGVSLLSLISGCSTATGIFTDPQPELGQVTVENSDDVPHTVHIVLERDSELIYGSSHQLEAVSTPENGEFGSIDTKILDDASWDEKTGKWTIYVRVDDETGWQRQAVPTDTETTCYSVRIKIEDNSSATIFTPDCQSWPPDVEQ